MSTQTLVRILVPLLAVFMLFTVVVALLQDEFEWSWWFSVPIGGGFVIAIIGFRLLVQRAAEEAERLDRELDAQGK